ncbi:thiamine pyrophosphate-binding protein [Nocardia sp. NPDC049220]|uniref:thiamine pyrophosphate-binding protein n=1 Tax=Nocardia sp. NPDC049220 TaxID=3155273 RepID=UPI0033EDA8EB
MTVADVVGRTLQRLGVGAAFGVVGSGNFQVTNALRSAGVAFYPARHEGGATTMADAYARMTDGVAVVTLHQGCGLTNAMTGIGEAAKSRTPLIVLAADTPGDAVRSNFRVAQDALAAAVGAVPERVYGPASAIADTVRAFRTARDGGRCVVLNLPIDIQALPAAWDTPPVPPTPHPVRPADIDTDRLTDLLRNSERPVFVAGRGARRYAADLRLLAASTGALLATSAVANGLFHDDPWSIGISGGFATPLAAELIRDADVLIGWGCALNMWTMRHGRLIGDDTTVVQVDNDVSALGAHRNVSIEILGDVGETARAVTAAWKRESAESNRYRIDDVRARIANGARWTQVAFDDLSTSDRIDPRVLSIALDRMLPEQRVVAVDSGNFMGYPSAYLAVPDQFGFCFTQAFQSVGLGLSTAIGAALAQPDRLAIAALGDGGALMGSSEFETVVRLGLPMVIVVYNDSAYGAEVHHFGVDNDLATVRFPTTDFAAMAVGMGYEAAIVRSVSDLDRLEKWLAGPRDRPILLDARIASDEGAWWLQEAFHKH